MQKKAVVLALILLSLSVVWVSSVLHFTFAIPNKARVKGVGVSIYWDYTCTRAVTEIDWGMLEPNETKTTLLYFQSQSNVNITLGLTTNNWNPPTAQTYITLTWNYTDIPLTPKTTIPIQLHLHIANNITGIDHFCFDIIICAEG